MHSSVYLFVSVPCPSVTHVHLVPCVCSSTKTVTPLKRSDFQQVEIIFHMKHVTCVCARVCVWEPWEVTEHQTQQGLYVIAQCKILFHITHSGCFPLHTLKSHTHFYSFTPLKPQWVEMGRSFHVQMLLIFIVRLSLQNVARSIDPTDVITHQPVHKDVCVCRLDSCSIHSCQFQLCVHPVMSDSRVQVFMW